MVTLLNRIAGTGSSPLSHALWALAPVADRRRASSPLALACSCPPSHSFTEDDLQSERAHTFHSEDADKLCEGLQQSQTSNATDDLAVIRYKDVEIERWP